MALTFSEKYSGADGAKLKKIIEVTHDESTGGFSAASVGMHWFDAVINGGSKGATLLADNMLTVTKGSGTASCEFTVLSAACVTTFILLGF